MHTDAGKQSEAPCRQRVIRQKSGQDPGKLADNQKASGCEYFFTPTGFLIGAEKSADRNELDLEIQLLACHFMICIKGDGRIGLGSDLDRETLSHRA